MKRILILLIAFVILGACIPSPDHEAIVNNSDKALQQALAAPNSERARYEPPARWEETIDRKNLKIRFDADIVLPEGDRFPVQTIRRHEFAPQDALNLLNACFIGPFEVRENPYSMEEIEEDIRYALRGSYSEDDVTGEITWIPPEEDSEELMELKARMAQCPTEDAFAVLTEERLVYSNIPYAVRTANGTLLYLWFTKNGLKIYTSRKGSPQDDTTVWQGGYIGEQRYQTIEEPSIVESEAVAACNAALERAGLSNEFGMGRAVRARNAQPILEAPYFEVLSTGYLLQVARNGGGYVPVPQGGGVYHEDRLSTLSDRDEAEYTLGWRMDWIEIYVSENGIESIGWYMPNEVVRDAKENMQLMPFPEIQQRIRENFIFGYAWSDEISTRIRELTITRVSLSCAIAQLPDQTDEAILVPAWVVTYRSDRSEITHAYDLLMVINAIDGSYLFVN